MERSDLYRDNGRVVALTDAAQAYTTQPIVACSRKVREQLTLLEKVADTELRVLICGERGTDLQQYAEYLHQRSARKNGPYVRFDCAATHAAQCREKLFGSACIKGNTTHIRTGVVELAQGGTLLLDNLFSLPAAFYDAVEALMETGMFTRRDAQELLPADVRLVATHTEEPKDPVQDTPTVQQLRQQLAVNIRIPPLRERPEDVALLTLWFLQQANRRCNRNKYMGSELFRAMLAYPWPGNERELKSFVEQAVLVTDETVLNTPDLLHNSTTGTLRHSRSPVTIDTLDRSLKELVREYELLIIRQSIRRYGSLRKAAKELQIAPSALSRKLAAAKDKS